MTKTEALNLMRCTQTELAREIGVLPQAIYLWPEKLSDTMRDRVQAAMWRRMHGEMVPLKVPRAAALAEAGA